MLSITYGPLHSWKINALGIMTSISITVLEMKQDKYSYLNCVELGLESWCSKALSIIDVFCYL